LSELRHVAKAREHEIARKSVGAVISANGALRQTHGDPFLTAEAELLGGDILLSASGLEKDVSAP
jgi:hypothetical protein